MGIVGIVIANIVNMLSRSWFCFMYPLSLFSYKGFRESIPSTWFWVSLVYGYIALKWISFQFSSQNVSKFAILLRLIYRAVLLVPVLWIVLRKEARV